MTAYAFAVTLVLEDKAKERAELVAALKEEGYTVVDVARAADAMAVVEDPDYRVHLAIVDLDLGGPGRFDLLRHMAAKMPNCDVIVYSAHLSSSEMRERVNNAHHDAVLRDKVRGIGSLMGNVRAKTAFTFGDLRLHPGHIELLGHPEVREWRKVRRSPVAVELLRARRRGRSAIFYNDTTAMKAVFRLKQWLITVNSEVAVHSTMAWTFELVLRADLPPDHPALVIVPRAARTRAATDEDSDSE